MSRLDYAGIKAIPFQKVLEHYGVKLIEKKHGAGDVKLEGRCPIHTDGSQEKRRNHLQITIASKNLNLVNTFHCFSCGARGTVIDFVVLMEKFVDVEMVDWSAVSEARKAGNAENWVDRESLKLASSLLHKWFLAKNGPPGPSKTAQEPQSAPKPMPDTSEPEKGEKRNKTWLEQWGKEPTYPKYFVPNNYLASRGIRPEVLAKFGVGFYSNPKSRSVVNDRILFPIHNQAGKLLAFAARTTEEDGARYWFPPIEKFDRTLELWNMHRALEEKDLIVVEGFFGAMNLWQHGFTCVVALMGSNLSEVQAELIAEHFASATFLLDPDQAGMKLGQEALHRLHGRLPLKMISCQVQPDQMTAEKLQALLE